MNEAPAQAEITPPPNQPQPTEEGKPTEALDPVAAADSLTQTANKSGIQGALQKLAGRFFSKPPAPESPAFQIQPEPEQPFNTSTAETAQDAQTPTPEPATSPNTENVPTNQVPVPNQEPLSPEPPAPRETADLNPNVHQATETSIQTPTPAESQPIVSTEQKGFDEITNLGIPIDANTKIGDLMNQLAEKGWQNDRDTLNYVQGALDFAKKSSQSGEGNAAVQTAGPSEENARNEPEDRFNQLEQKIDQLTQENKGLTEFFMAELFKRDEVLKQILEALKEKDEKKKNVLIELIKVLIAGLVFETVTTSTSAVQNSSR